MSKKISAKDQHKTPEAITTAKELLRDLQAARSKMKRTIEAPAADINAARLQFRTACRRAIDAARDVLERDLGWGTYLNNLLKSIYNTIAHIFTNNPSAFYNMTRAESVQTVEKAQSKIEVAANTVPPVC